MTRYIVTGTFSTGKTTLIDELARRGHRTVAEPSRAVLAEQRASGGRGTYDQDRGLFQELMLDRAVADHAGAEGADGPVFFDRGVPDLVAFAQINGVDEDRVLEAAGRLRYEPVVFWAPLWEEIYVNDEERRATIADAQRFQDLLGRVFHDLGYERVDLGQTTVERRAELIEAATGSAR